MVHVQPVKSVWSTLHKVLLQTVGNKQRETEQRALLCLEEEAENGAAKRTQEAFSVNFPKRFPAHTLHAPLLPTPNHPLLLCHSYSAPVLHVFKFQR